MKFKKILIAAMSIACVGASFGLISKKDKASEVKADSFNTIETTCWSYCAGNNSYGHVVFHLTDNDFTPSATTSYAYGTYAEKLEALNLKDYILINNHTLSWSQFNEYGFKFSVEVYTNAFSPTDGTFSIGINVLDGHSFSEINSVRVLKGVQFPSKGYLEGTSNDIYTIPENIESVPTACNYDWATYADVKVWNVATVDNTYLGLRLNYSDLPTTFVDGSVGDGFTNYQSFVSINDGAIGMATSSYGLFNYQGIDDCIWLQTTANSSGANKVTVSAGTIFRSYHVYTTSPSWPLWFRVKETHTFTKDTQGHWIPFFEDVETTVEKVSQASINSEWPTFKLSVSDYNTARQADFGIYSGEQANLWNNIEITDSSNIVHPAKDIFANYAHIFDFNGSIPGTIALNSISGYKALGDLLKIFIPSGTQFPSFEYLNNHNVINPKRFVTTEDLTFIYCQSGLWAKCIDTSVEAMDWNSNGYLSFKLSNNDYSEANYAGSFEGTYANLNSIIDLSAVGLSFDSSRYSVWNYGSWGTNYAGALAPHCSGTPTFGGVTIPAGTNFPSYVFSTDNTTNPLVFRTTEAACFYYNGEEFVNALSGWTIPNNVTAMTTHHANITESNPNDYAIDFVMENYDWPTSIHDLDCRNPKCDPNFVNNYNTLSKIHVYDAQDNELTKTSELFINVWGETGKYSIRLVQAGSHMSEVHTVLIESGCEFPTYAGLYVDAENSKTSDFSRYITTTTTKFSFNYSTGVFTKVDAYNAIATTISAINEINKEETNSFLSFSLSANDYGTRSFEDLCELDLSRLNDLNFANYITVNGVKISSMACHGNAEIFVNLFGHNGTLSLRTTGNNTGCYYIRNSVRYSTEDLTNYEVCIAAGCQFPSYAYISGATDDLTCYEVQNDTRFAWVDDHYELEDSSFEEPTLMSNTILDAEYVTTSDPADKAIMFTLNSSDWPTAESINNGQISDTLSCYSLRSHIVIVDTDDVEHLLVSTEVFINVWGTGTENPTVGVRLPLGASDIKKIEVLKGALFPTRSNFANSDNKWYELSKTQTFYSSLDGSFYSGNYSSAKEYAQAFSGAINEVCYGYDGTTDNTDALTNKFYAFENIYNEQLTTDMKNELFNSSDSDIVAMRTAYDFVVRKYGLNDFLSISDSSPKGLRLFQDMSRNSIAVIVATMAVSLTILALYNYKWKKGRN